QGAYVFGLLRYKPDGALDQTFGNQGTVIQRIGNGGGEGARALIIQPDGKILVAGSTELSGREVSTVVRFLPNGSLDRTFGTDGIAIFYVGSSSRACGLATQNDGRILVSGTVQNGKHSEFGLLRLTPDGSLDGTFGKGGIATRRVPVDDVGYAVVPRMDGTLISTGPAGGPKLGTTSFATLGWSYDGR